MPTDESSAQAMMLLGSEWERIPFDGICHNELTFATPDDDPNRIPFVIPRNASFTCSFKPPRMNRKRFVKGLVNNGWSKKSAKRVARRLKKPYGSAYWFYVFTGEENLT